MKSKQIKNILKLAVTVVGLYIAYQQMDLETVTQIITTYDYKYLLAGVLLNCLGTVLLSARLREVFGRSQSLLEMIKINFVASFFNLFLPSTIGGDTVKVTRLAGGQKSLQRSLAKVFADRFYGVTAVLMISIVSLLLLRSSGTVINVYILYSVYFLTAATVGVWLSIQTGLLTWFINRVPEVKLFGLHKTFKLGNLVSAIEELKAFSVGRKFNLLFISVIYQINSALISYVGLISFGIHISLLHVIFFSSLSAVLLMIPISIGGLGTRELIYKGLYGTVTDSVKVVLLAPYGFITLVATGLIGGILFMYDKPKN
jgi:uncharacterized protein (TIRG00374 family)